ncbi:MAG: hypothetical protein JKY70_15850 [Mucilaginibacter sp.]|nr:hypothetical protein [Mucilaginibacter sp.]
MVLGAKMCKLGIEQVMIFSYIRQSKPCYEDLHLHHAFATLLTSCSKPSSQPKPIEPDDPNSVTIDGTKYPVIKYGNQRWTVVNYNGSGGANYNDSPSNDPKYGKLYTHNEALAIKLPNGWRLPTTNDYQILITPYQSNIKDLMSKTGWIEKLGTNELGFNVFPVGYKFAFEYIYDHVGYESSFLTTSFNEEGTHRGFFNFISYSGTAGAGIFYVPKNDDQDRASIRFVKDE